MELRAKPDRVIRPYHEWLDLAADILLSAGFALKYTSLGGSRYFHFPGRIGGMLRLSDHAKSKPDGVAAMLTIHAQCFPKNEFKARRMVAEAIGWYFLHTARVTTAWKPETTKTETPS